MRAAPRPSHLLVGRNGCQDAALFFGEIAMARPGLVSHHCDIDGRIATKHRNTLISTLRLTYGIGFAPKERAAATLGEVLDWLDELSLAKIIANLPSNER
jgi:hypothetical protein